MKVAVLPASAGMIPAMTGRPCHGPSAPRIRGDDPDYGLALTGEDMCSPHPRG